MACCRLSPWSGRRLSAAAVATFFGERLPARCVSNHVSKIFKKLMGGESFLEVICNMLERVQTHIDRLVMLSGPFLLHVRMLTPCMSAERPESAFCGTHISFMAFLFQSTSKLISGNVIPGSRRGSLSAHHRGHVLPSRQTEEVRGFSVLVMAPKHTDHTRLQHAASCLSEDH